MKRQVLLICSFGIAASLIGSIFSATWDEELAWLGELDRVKSAAVTKAAPNRILLVGGSSVLFGLDPAVIQEWTGRTTINLGMHAGLGGLVLLGYAEKYSQPGDLVVLSLEPEALQDTDWPPLGRRFAYHSGDLQLLQGGRTTLRSISLMDRIETQTTFAQPGLPSIVTRIADALLGDRLDFPYPDLEIDQRGYIRERATASFDPLSTRPPGLGEDWPRVLEKFASHMGQGGIDVVYSLPWVKISPEQTQTTRRQSSHFLQAMNDILPVIPEPGCGLYASDDLFADTAFHLSVQGARRRSIHLGRALASQNFLGRGTLDGDGCEE